MDEFPNPPNSKYSPPPTTIPNVKHMCDKYGIKVRYNMIKKKLMIRLLGRAGLADNADNTTATRYARLSARSLLEGASLGSVPMPKMQPRAT